MADTGVPLARDYELERSTAPLRRAPAIDHPFLHKEKPSNRGGVSMVVKKPSTAAAAAAAAEETKAVDDDDPLGLNDPLSGGNPGDADDPLSAYMASDDPLSAYEADPLSGGGGSRRFPRSCACRRAAPCAASASSSCPASAAERRTWCR